MIDKLLLFIPLTLLSTWPLRGQEPTDNPQQALIARAASLELDTEYVPPPGDPQSHHASGFAKILGSAVFVTGLDPKFAAENIGFFTCPYEERADVDVASRSRAWTGACYVTQRSHTDSQVPRGSGLRDLAAGRRRTVL